MIRVLAAALALSSLTWGQSLANKKAFFHEVNGLRSRMLDGQPIDPVRRIQEEVGILPSSASAVFEAAVAYNSGADKIESDLGRSILTRRLQIAGEFRVTYSSELDMVNWANLDLNLLLLERLEDLRESMAEEEYGRLAQFIDDRLLFRPYFPLEDGETGPVGSSVGTGWQQSPAGYWRDSIKAPLSGPLAEDLFLQGYKDTVIPPPDVVPYLEGIVVAVTPEDSRGRKVLLSMDGGDSAEAALLIDNEEWKLKSEPAKGAVVRFSGVAIELSPEPLLILIAPDRISGLSVESRGVNPPFTIPGLAR